MFDSRFLIQGSDEARIQAIFADVVLREAILFQPPAQFAKERNQPCLDSMPVPGGGQAIVCRYEHVLEKLDQLQGALDILRLAIIRLADTHDSRGRLAPSPRRRAGAAMPSEETPTMQAQTRRLHSPLLDRS